MMTETKRISTIFIYIVAMTITGSSSAPFEVDTGSGQLSLCKKDFDIKQTIQQCPQAGLPILPRYHFDTLRATCTQTYACSIGFSETHSTSEECIEACSEDFEPVEQCSPLPQPANTNLHYVSCRQSDCTVYYSCAKGYDLYPKENEGRSFYCKEGVWQNHTVHCAKVSLNVYVDGEKIDDSIKDITTESGKEVTLSCEVTGDVNPEDYTITWSLNNHVQTSSDELIIPSITSDNEGTYNCTVSGMINKQLIKKLKVLEKKAPKLIVFEASVTKGRTLKGACVCQGYPKPTSWWTVNERSYSNDLTMFNQQFTYNVLQLDLEPGTHNVSCQCNNSLGLLESEQLKVNVSVTSKRRRSVEKLTSSSLESLCVQDHQSAIVTGKVLRQSRSIVHLKAETVLSNKGNTNAVSKDDIIRIVSNGQRLDKNEKYTLKIQKKDGKQVLIHAFPYVAGIDLVLPSSCSSPKV